MMKYSKSRNLASLPIIWLMLFGFQTIVLGQNSSELAILETFKHKETVVYKTVDGSAMDFTIFYPEPGNIKKENPWMMHVHGGGWAGGSKFNVLKKSFLGTLQQLLDNGVICVTIQYRKARDGNHSYDSVVDAKDAARFLLKNSARFKLDDEDYGIWGGSAGGHLSLVTALSKEADFKGESALSAYKLKFKCIAAYFPFTSCLNPALRPGSIFEDEKLFVRLLGAPLKDKLELAKLLSPTEYLEESSPPILLLHGDKDPTLPIINSTYMIEEAKSKNADVELLTVKNAGHSFKGPNISPSIAEVNKYAAEFILAHLK